MREPKDYVEEWPNYQGISLEEELERAELALEVARQERCARCVANIIGLIWVVVAVGVLAVLAML